MGPVNRPLDLDWLEDFLALVETGNFSRAAQQRGIAQPAFSRHIRSLEEWAGVELIDRAQHPATATPAGDIFLLTAREVVLKLTQGRARAIEAQDQASRSLQFAATHVLSLAFFPSWLQQIEQSLQLGPLHMTSDSFQACEDLMLQRRVQFLLCYGHPAVQTRLVEPHFAQVRVSRDRLIPVAAPGSAAAIAQLAQAMDARPPDLEQPLPVLLYSQASGLGQIMRAELPQVFDTRRFVPAITSHHAVLLKTMALEGRGIAWLPKSLIASELRDGTLVRSADVAFDVPVEIRLIRGTGPLPEAAEAVWAQVSRAASGLPAVVAPLEP